MFRLGNQGPQFNADLPFILDKLLPYMSQDELQTAKLQFEDTKEAIENIRRGLVVPYYQRPNIPRELVQTISDMLDDAMIEKKNNEPHHSYYDDVHHHSTSSSSFLHSNPS